MLIWLTGTPCSGKTTIAYELQNKLTSDQCTVLDGDEVRKQFTTPLPPGEPGRRENLNRILTLALTALEQKTIVVAAVVSPSQQLREYARKQIEGSGHRFVEIYIKATLATCLIRDVKGLYVRALAGEEVRLPGFNDDYDVPEKPELVITTDQETKEASAEAILSWIAERV